MRETTKKLVRKAVLAILVSAAAAVKRGWKAREAQLAIVSPEKPTGYLCEPGPA